MKDKKVSGLMKRREFNKLLVGAAVTAPSFLVAQADKKSEKLEHRNERKSMTYHRLGRTNFMCSRLVFGCGAALRGGRGVRLLDRAFEAGINHYDVGCDVAYSGSERTLAPFLKANRGKIWVSSKAPLGAKGMGAGEKITVDTAKQAAELWTKLLNTSLKDLQTDYVDAYYLMAVENADLISSEEINNAFLAAKSAGKVGYFGISTHKNAKNMLEAAIKTGWYDLAMIGITPAGWYDWSTKEIEKNTQVLVKLQSLLSRAKDTGIGLVGMKTVRFLASMNSLGKGDPSAFDKHYNKEFMASTPNPFQRAYTFVLEHGIDVVNADMQNFKHLEENIIAAASAKLNT